MSGRPESDVAQHEALQIAAAVRDACLRAAQDAYAQAATSGLCGEGAWECAVGALRSLHLEDVLRIAGVPPEPQQRRRRAEGGE